jgi:hypothetical protein
MPRAKSVGEDEQTRSVPVGPAEAVKHGEPLRIVAGPDIEKPFRFGHRRDGLGRRQDPTPPSMRAQRRLQASLLALHDRWMRFARNDDIFFLKTSINATVPFVALLGPVINMYRLPKSPATLSACARRRTPHLVSRRTTGRHGFAQAQIPAPGSGPTRRIRRAGRADAEIFLLAKH